MKKRKVTDQPVETAAGEVPASREQARIAAWLKRTKFKKRLFGGVDEADVWRKLEELNRLYEDAVLAERVRCEVTTKQYKAACDEAVKRYVMALRQRKSQPAGSGEKAADA